MARPNTNIVSSEKLDYLINVVLRRYVEASEESDCLYDEVGFLEEVLGVVIRENADLRYRLKLLNQDVPEYKYDMDAVLDAIERGETPSEVAELTESKVEIR